MKSIYIIAITFLATVCAFCLIGGVALVFRKSIPAKVQSGPESAEKPSPIEACVFNIEVYKKNYGNGNFERVAGFGPIELSVPRDFFPVTELLFRYGIFDATFNESLELKSTKLDRHSVDFLVSLNGEVRPIKAMAHVITDDPSFFAKTYASSAEFNEGLWKVELSIDATSRPPFLPNDDLLRGPVWLYAKDIANRQKDETDRIQVGQAEMEAKVEITDQKTIDEIKSLLSNAKHFDLQGSRCYIPRTALSFGSVGNATEIVFCRQCSWVQVYIKGEEHTIRLKYGLGKRLHEMVDELRRKYFPDQEDK